MSPTVEYALRAMVFPADQTAQAVIAEAIAVGSKVPFGYLAKIMQGMIRAVLVGSQCGLQGGFRLRKPGCDLTVSGIVQSVDPIIPHPPPVRSVRKAMAPTFAPAPGHRPCHRGRWRWPSAP